MSVLTVMFFSDFIFIFYFLVITVFAANERNVQGW